MNENFEYGLLLKMFSDILALFVFRKVRQNETLCCPILSRGCFLKDDNKEPLFNLGDEGHIQLHHYRFRWKSFRRQK